MTAVIISILCALGIGGGVMVASSGGGHSSGGAAVVAPVNPGGNDGNSTTGSNTTGGSSNTGGNTTGNNSNTGNTTTGNNSNTGNTTTGGNSNTGNTTTGTTTTTTTGGSSLSATTLANMISPITFNNSTAIQTGGILASGPSTAKIVSKSGNARVQNGRLIMDINAFAPILTGNNTYTTNETYGYIGNKTYMSGYLPAGIQATFDLTQIFSQRNLYDMYVAPNYSPTSNTPLMTKVLPTINFKYISGNGVQSAGIFNNMTWSLNTTNLALGGRQLGLINSDFGWISATSTFSHPDLDTRRGSRYAAQTLYIYDSAKQLRASNYLNRYANNTASFYGNIIGVKRRLLSCGNNTGSLVTGNISLTLNFNTLKLTGALSNMGSALLNVNLQGDIYNITSSAPNFVITNVSSSSYTYTPYNSNNFGEGVIVKGTTAAKDEVVGEMSFTWGSNGGEWVQLAFGAKR